MTDRDCIDAMIQSAVGDCPPYWSIVITDYLIANGVVVREKGEWVPVLDGGGQQCEEEIFARWWRCPVCGEENFHSNFCPDCGSDMRIEEQNRARSDCDSSDICIECWDEVDLFYGSSPCVDLPVGKERNK